MAKLNIVVDLPTLSRDDVIALVVANDDAMSAVNDEPGIAPEFVKALDVLRLWLMGDFPNVPEVILTNEIED